ncbi:5239_t:CDS:1, partial [Ambispora gerdemannii]
MTFATEEDLANARKIKLILDNHQLEWVNSNTKTCYYCHSSTHSISNCHTKTENQAENNHNSNTFYRSNKQQSNPLANDLMDYTLLNTNNTLLNTNNTELKESDNETNPNENNSNSSSRQFYNISQHNKFKSSYAQAVKQISKTNANELTNRL